MGLQALRKLETVPILPYGPEDTDIPFRKWGVDYTRSYRRFRRLEMLELDGPDTIVIHATAGGTSSGAMSVMQGGTASWHFLVPAYEEKGFETFVWQCVPLESSAWHVLSKVRHPIDGKKNINDRSFGIEMVNQQRANTPFPEWQVIATAAIVRYLRSKYPIKWIFTHAYCDPARKLDPGILFPWDSFMDMVTAPDPVPNPLNLDKPWMDVDGYAMPAVEQAVASGVMNGTDPGHKLFGGREPLRRQDLAVVLDRLGLLKTTKQKPKKRVTDAKEKAAKEGENKPD